MEVRHFCRRPFPGAFSIESLFVNLRRAISLQQVEVIHLQAPHLSKGILRRILNIAWAWKNRSDINHITGDIHYIALGLPARRTILTIHDLHMLDRLSGVARKVVKLLWFDLPLRRVALVTVISNATKDDLVSMLGVNPEKIVVIPNIIHERFQASPRQFATAKPTIVHIGTKPNKNLERLIEALNGVSCHLKIVGRLTERQRSLLAEHSVQYTNGWDLSDEEIHQCYLDSDMLCFISTKEGFGVPIIEAQKVGRAVVTSNCSSMPEVAGCGACLVDPLDVSSIRRGIQRVISDGAFRSELLSRGFANCERFASEAIARQYIEAYKQIASNRQ